ncbi:unnamed protein product, partial [marine sediment metagenome]
AKEFSAQRTDYLLCNRPGEMQKRIVRRHRVVVCPGEWPILPAEFEITPDTVMRLEAVDAKVGLYYRDLFAHKLGSVPSE